MNGAACYDAKPIWATLACFFCLGEPKRAPDPYLRQFKKNGLREGDTKDPNVVRVASQYAMFGD